MKSFMKLRFLLLFMLSFVLFFSSSVYAATAYSYPSSGWFTDISDLDNSDIDAGEDDSSDTGGDNDDSDGDNGTIESDPKDKLGLLSSVTAKQFKGTFTCGTNHSKIIKTKVSDVAAYYGNVPVGVIKKPTGIKFYCNGSVEWVASASPLTDSYHIKSCPSDPDFSKVYVRYQNAVRMSDGSTYDLVIAPFDSGGTNSNCMHFSKKAIGFNVRGSVKQCRVGLGIAVMDSDGNYKSVPLLMAFNDLDSTPGGNRLWEAVELPLNSYVWHLGKDIKAVGKNDRGFRFVSTANHANSSAYVGDRHCDGAIVYSFKTDGGNFVKLYYGQRRKGKNMKQCQMGTDLYSAANYSMSYTVHYTSSGLDSCGSCTLNDDAEYSEGDTVRVPNYSDSNSHHSVTSVTSSEVAGLSNGCTFTMPAKNVNINIAFSHAMRTDTYYSNYGKDYYGQDLKNVTITESSKTDKYNNHDAACNWTVSRKYNHSFTLPSNLVVRSNGNVVKKLVGWTDDKGNTYNSTKGWTVSDETAKNNLTFTAQWEFATYTVTYKHSNIANIVNDDNYDPASVDFTVDDIPVDEMILENVNSVSSHLSDYKLDAEGAGTNVLHRIKVTATKNPPLPQYSRTFNTILKDNTKVTVNWGNNYNAHEKDWDGEEQYYTFVSWKSADGSKTYAGQGDPVYSDQTYVCDFKRVVHTLTYFKCQPGKIDYLDGNENSRSVTPKIVDMVGDSDDVLRYSVTNINSYFRQWIGSGTSMKNEKVKTPKEEKGVYTFKGWRYEVGNRDVVYKVPDRIVMDIDKDLKAIWGNDNPNIDPDMPKSSDGLIPNCYRIEYDYNKAYFDSSKDSHLHVERDDYLTAYDFDNLPKTHYQIHNYSTILSNKIPTVKLKSTLNGGGQVVADFVGWSTDPDASNTGKLDYGKLNNKEYMGNAPLKLYAIWKLREFDITFYDNPNRDAANDWGIVVDKTRVNNDPLKRANTNMTSGSRDKWYVRFKKQFDHAFKIPNIVPDQDGSDKDSTYDKSAEYGSEGKDGYDFIGWQDRTGSGLGSNEYYYAALQGENPDTIAYDVNSDRNLYATWNIHSNSVTYNANVADTSIITLNTNPSDYVSAGINYEVGKAFSRKFDRWVYTKLKGDTCVCDFTRIGWVSVGWSHNSNSTVTLEPGRKFLMPNHSINLFAITKRDHKLTLSSDRWKKSDTTYMADTIYNKETTFKFDTSEFKNDTARADHKEYKVYFAQGNDSRPVVITDRGAYPCNYTPKGAPSRNDPSSSVLVHDSGKYYKNLSIYFDGWYIEKDTDDIHSAGDGTKYVAFRNSPVNVKVYPNEAYKYDVIGSVETTLDTTVTATSGDGWVAAKTVDATRNNSGSWDKSITNDLEMRKTNAGSGKLYAHYTTPVVILPDAVRTHPSTATIEYNQNFKQEQKTTADRVNPNESDKFMGWFSEPQKPNGEADTRTNIVFYGMPGDEVHIDSDLLDIMDAQGKTLTFYPWFNIFPQSVTIRTGVKFYEDQTDQNRVDLARETDLSNFGSIDFLKTLVDVRDPDHQQGNMTEDYTFYGYNALSKVYGMNITSFLNIAYPDMPEDIKNKIVAMADKNRFSPVIKSIEYCCDGLDSDMKHYSTRTSGEIINNPVKVLTDRDHVGTIRIVYEYHDAEHTINKLVASASQGTKAYKNDSRAIGNTQCEWTETVEAEIMFNDPPTIEVNNVYVYSTGKEVNVDNIRNYLVKRQNAKDEQDDFDNLPWWSAENRDGWKGVNGTRRKLDDNIDLEKVGDITFDYGFENTDAEHKALCSRLKLSCHEPEDIFGLKDSSNELEKQAFLHIKSFKAYFITRDQFGKTNATSNYTGYGDTNGNKHPFFDLTDRRYGQLDEERCADVLMFNNQDDDALGDAMVNEDVRYITADTLLEDDSYWADDKSDGGAAKLRETFQNKRDADNGKKPSSVTHDKVGDTNVTIEDY